MNAVQKEKLYAGNPRARLDGRKVANMKPLRSWVAVTLMTVSAQAAFASWSLDTEASPNTLSDGNWTLKVLCQDATANTYAIGASGNASAYVAGSGELDLSTVKADTGATLVKVCNNAMMGVSGLTSLKLPETMTQFGDKCFQNCSELVSVTPFLPGGTTILGVYAFQKCYKLTGDLILTNAAITTVEKCAFEGCKIPSACLNPKLKVIGNCAFMGCGLKKLTPMDLPELEKIDDGNRLMLEGDTLTLSSPNLSYIGSYAFSAPSFTNLVLSPTITTIGASAFYESANLETVKLVPMSRKLVPTTAATLGNQAFNHCSKLRYVELPFRGAYSLGDWFFGLTQITNLVFWGAAPQTIGNMHFSTKAYNIRFTCSPQQDESGWLAYATSLTEEEKQKETYPGPNCFGTLTEQTPKTWLVWGRSPYDPKGLVILIK